MPSLDLPRLAALSGNHPSDAITDVLGIMAVCSFFGIALYIAMQVLRDTSRKPVVASSNSGDFRRESAPKPMAAAPKVEENELQKLEKHCELLLTSVVETGRKRLEDIAHVAGETFNQVAGGYASNSFGHEGENHVVRAKKFLSVCERQWGALRSEIGYMSYIDVLEHLRHILANHRMLDGLKNAKSEVVDLNPEVLRSQELIILMRVVPKDKVRCLQDQLMTAIAGYRTVYQSEYKAWLNDQIVKINNELRTRKSRSVQVADTDYYKKFRQLKARLEVVARLSEGITESTQQVSEFGLALSQVIHVGAQLRIIAGLPEWFGELGLTSQSEDD